MAEIKPFKPLIYNPERIGDLSKVVCPPYDVISPKEMQGYYNAHEANFIRILLPQEQKRAGKLLINKYKNANSIFKRWQDKGILISDKKEAIYFYQQEFISKGEKKSRTGFIALMRLADKDKQPAHPHETTRKTAKDDRYALLKTVQANLSPIFTIFRDEERQLTRIFDNYLAKELPFLELKDRQGDTHRLWRLDDVKLVKRLRAYMKNKQIFIADGHHRYEVACQFQQDMLRRAGNNPAARLAPFNYILTYFLDMNSRGLLILPTHRLVKKLSKNPIQKLEEFFAIERIDDRFSLLYLLKKATESQNAFGLYWDSKFYLLRLNRDKKINSLLKDGSVSYNRLDVVVLNKIVFEHIFALSAEAIEYIKEESEAIQAVDSANFAAAFFLCPTKVEEIRAVALNHERMPPKSTYFYPKLLSGLLIHKF